MNYDKLIYTYINAINTNKTNQDINEYINNNSLYFPKNKKIKIF